MIVLGPAVCQGCGKLVFFDGSQWYRRKGHHHRCNVRFWPTAEGWLRAAEAIARRAA